MASKEADEKAEKAVLYLDFDIVSFSLRLSATPQLRSNGQGGHCHGRVHRCDHRNSAALVRSRKNLNVIAQI